MYQSQTQSEPSPTAKTMNVYIHQDRNTGKPSTSILTFSDVCIRLSNYVQNKLSLGNSPQQGHFDASSEDTLLHPETLLLEYNTENFKYHEIGWTPANDIDGFRESSASWYYEGSDSSAKGPLSVEHLAYSFYSGFSKGEETKVWSGDIKRRCMETELGKQGRSSDEWKKIGDLPHLKTVIQCFSQKLNVKKSTETLGIDSNISRDEKLDPSLMVYDFSEENDKNCANKNRNGEREEIKDEVTRELEAFINGEIDANSYNFDDDLEESYESDGGSFYVKNPKSGQWKNIGKKPILLTSTNTNPSLGSLKDHSKKKEVFDISRRSKKKTKFASKNSKCWIYVKGLPLDTNEEELTNYFSRAGILSLDPGTQLPKIKLYKDKVSGKLKGDASICYARTESVELALQVLDDSIYRSDGSYRISVERAKFEQHGQTYDESIKKRKVTAISSAQRKVARLAALQAVGWDNGENGRISGGLKGLRIVVLKGMFQIQKGLEELEDSMLKDLEKQIKRYCFSKWGPDSIEKITIFSKNPHGIVIIKFTLPSVASDAVVIMNGIKWMGNPNVLTRVEATFWDGVMDYTLKPSEDLEKAEEEKRHEDFGAWLDNQDLPEELRLNEEK